MHADSCATAAYARGDEDERRRWLDVLALIERITRGADPVSADLTERIAEVLAAHAVRQVEVYSRDARPAVILCLCGAKHGDLRRHQAEQVRAVLGDLIPAAREQDALTALSLMVEERDAARALIADVRAHGCCRDINAILDATEVSS
jgi:hypothetical protein